MINPKAARQRLRRWVLWRWQGCHSDRAVILRVGTIDRTGGGLVVQGWIGDAYRWNRSPRQRTAFAQGYLVRYSGITNGPLLPGITIRPPELRIAGWPESDLIARWPKCDLTQ